MNLIGYDEVRERIWGYLSGREWWCILGASEAMSLIEDTHYTGEKSSSFHMMIGSAAMLGLGGGLIAIAFANKKYMSTEEIGNLLGATPDKDQDILLCYTEPEPSQSLLAVFFGLTQLYEDEKAKRN